MKKRTSYLFAVIVGLLMVFAIMPLSMEQAYADTEITVDGVKYKLNNEEMTAQVVGYTDDIPSDVTIPETVGDDPLNQYTVTSIKGSSFYFCDKLESIILPANLRSIGAAAFGASTGLKTVEFAEGCKLESIGEDAFSYCSNMKSITFPSGVKRILRGAFSDCRLTSFNYLGSKDQWNEVTGDGKPEIQGAFDVIFEDGDGNVLQFSRVASGMMPSYHGATPTREADEQHVNVFCGWNLDFTPVIEDTTYIAVFFTMDAYRIQFVNEDGTELQTSKVAYGKTPEYTGKTPTRLATEEYTFIFAGWDPEITTVTGDATYTAKYDKVPNYKITFINEDGTELQSSPVALGATPVYTGATPTRAADAQYLYTFKDWTPEIAPVTGEATYTATYDKTPRISIKGVTLALSAKAFTYNGKVRKPAIKTVKTTDGKKLTAGTDYKVNWSNTKSKNVGAYTVTVTGKGQYTGTTKKATYKINPKGTSIAKAVAAKKAFTVKWKKQFAKMATSRITGYQIRYSTKSSMKSAKTVTIKGYKKTSKKIAKLKAKKKYYVQVRTYKIVKSKKYYSTWSKKTAVKTQ